MRHATSAAMLSAALVLTGCTAGTLGADVVGAEADGDAPVDERARRDGARPAERPAADGADADSPMVTDVDDTPPATAATPSAAAPTPGPTATPTPPSAPAFADAAVILRRDTGFDPGTITAVEALDGVARVGGTRNDEVALWSSTASDGAAVDRFADGFKVLVTARVDIAELPGPRLDRGQVLLTPAGAALRDGLDVGGTLVVGPDRTALTVVAIAADQEPYGSAELVVHPDDADLVALEPLDRLFVLFDVGADVEAAAEDARDLLGTDEPRAVEVRDLAGGAGRRTLPISTVKRLFGEFSFRDVTGTRDITQDPAWREDAIVTARVPLVGAVTCHRDIIDPLTAALTAVADAGFADWIDPSRNGGCWAPRRTSEGGNLSKHAWGIAVDVNVDFSLPGGGPIPPDEVITAFRDNGFSWGGDFPTPDNHHWEWVGSE